MSTNYVQVIPPPHKHKPLKVTQTVSGYGLTIKPVSWYQCQVCHIKVAPPQEAQE